MKTIVQIVRTPAGGIRKHVLDICMDRVRRGDRVILVTDLREADELFKAHGELDWFKQMKLILLDIPRNPHPKDILNLVQLKWTLRGFNIDLFHGHGAKGGIYGRLLGGRRKSIYSPHGGSLHGNYGPLKNRIYFLVEKLLLPVTGKVLVESQYTYQQFRSKVSTAFERVAINFNGLNFPDTMPLLTQPRHRIVALGLLRQLKGFDLLVRAAGSLKNDFPDLRVEIYGDGEERASLAALIGKLKLERHVFLMGETESPNTVYGASDLVVVPSRFESFGLVALEAIASGKPVVAASTGGLIELIRPGETGRLFASENVDELVRSVRAAFENWPLTEEMARTAFKYAREKHSLSGMLDGLEKAYNEIIFSNESHAYPERFRRL